MARKPNYNFEKMERDRAKAAKKAERLALKQEKSDAKKAENAPEGADAPEGVDAPEASED